MGYGKGEKNLGKQACLDPRAGSGGGEYGVGYAKYRVQKGKEIEERDKLCTILLNQA